MASFAFHFDVLGDADTAMAIDSNDAACSSLSKDTLPASVTPALRAAECISPPASSSSRPPFTSIPIVPGLSMEIARIDTQSVAQMTEQIGSIVDSSDLASGVYEGGFKLWECSVDLVRFVATQSAFATLEGKRVAELGCGHGLPGIFALQRGAAHVAFMDYNREVLELTTWPNIIRNMQQEASVMSSRAVCYAGAWEHVSMLLTTGAIVPGLECQYDLILTAETIYTEQVSNDLYQMLKRHLHPDGIALVAAKKYYFGTGGGIAHFLGLLHTDNALQGDIVWDESDGLSNMRAIISVRWIQSQSQH